MIRGIRSSAPGREAGPGERPAAQVPAVACVGCWRGEGIRGCRLHMPAGTRIRGSTGIVLGTTARALRNGGSSFPRSRRASESLGAPAAEASRRPTSGEGAPKGWVRRRQQTAPLGLPSGGAADEEAAIPRRPPHPLPGILPPWASRGACRLADKTASAIGPRPWDEQRATRERWLHARRRLTAGEVACTSYVRISRYVYRAFLTAAR